MTYVEKWTHGKPRLTALFAPQIASFAREIPEILKFQKKHRLLTHTFQVPHFPFWYSLYRSRTLYLMPFVQMIIEGSPFAQQLLGLSFTIFEISRHPEKLASLSVTPESLKEGDNFWDDLIRMSFADIQENFDNTPLPPEVRPTVQHYKDNHETELAFLFLVAFPCWLFYKEWPTKLYRKARQGDTSAIHKLLRLDPFLLHDPSIGREIQKVRIYGKKSVYVDLLNAPLKPIKLKLTSRTIKDSLAGLISVLADAMKQPLTSIEIRDLFDAITKDADKRDIDTSLPDSQEAYSKVIQRNRTDWKPLLSTGHKKLK
jgi:hypothetical protein